MASVMAMKGRYLRGYHNSSFTQLQSQPKSNQCGAFPNINARGNSKDTDNNFRNNNIIGKELVNETEFTPTNLPLIVSSKKLKAKNKKSIKGSEPSGTLAPLINYEESGKEALCKDDDSKTLLRVSLGVKAKGKLITGLPMHKKSKSRPITYFSDGTLWEVHNSRVYLPETTSSQDFSGRKRFTKNNRVCSCGATGPKHCMLHLMEVVQNFRKQRNKQVKWVPMSLCTTYV